MTNKDQSQTTSRAERLAAEERAEMIPACEECRDMLERGLFCACDRGQAKAVSWARVEALESGHPARGLALEQRVREILGSSAQGIIDAMRTAGVSFVIAGGIEKAQQSHAEQTQRLKECIAALEASSGNKVTRVGMLIEGLSFKVVLTRPSADEGDEQELARHLASYLLNALSAPNDAATLEPAKGKAPPRTRIVELDDLEERMLLDDHRDILELELRTREPRRETSHAPQQIAIKAVPHPHSVATLGGPEPLTMSGSIDAQATLDKAIAGTDRSSLQRSRDAIGVAESRIEESLDLRCHVWRARLEAMPASAIGRLAGLAQQAAGDPSRIGDLFEVALKSLGFGPRPSNLVTDLRAAIAARDSFAVLAIVAELDALGNASA